MVGGARGPVGPSDGPMVPYPSCRFNRVSKRRTGGVGARVDGLLPIVATALAVVLAGCQRSGRVGAHDGDRGLRGMDRVRGRSKTWLRVDAKVSRDAGNTNQIFRHTDRQRRKPEDKPERRGYPSDFTDAEWAEVESNLSSHATVAPEAHGLRDGLDAIRSVAATGRSWRDGPARCQRSCAPLPARIAGRSFSMRAIRLSGFFRPPSTMA